MDPAHSRFLLFLVIALCALSLGILVRRRRPRPALASNIHLATVACTWAPLSILSFWRLRIGSELLAGLILQIVFLLAGWYAGSLVARWRGWSPRDSALFCAAAALGNQGFTMGAFICYNLLTDGETARDYAIAYVTFLAVLIVLLVYPLVNTKAAAGTMNFLELTKASFVTLKAAPLYGAFAGFMLNLCGVAPPDFDYNRLSLWLFNIGACGAYLGIGLNLTTAWRRTGEMQLFLAAIKFAVVPLCAYFVLSLLPKIGIVLDPTFRAVIAIESTMPAAIASVIIANFFHLDAERAGGLWLGNTILFLMGPLWGLIWLYG